LVQAEPPPPPRATGHRQAFEAMRSAKDRLTPAHRTAVMILGEGGSPTVGWVGTG